MYSERFTLVYAPIKDSDHPAHPRSLIRVFNGRLSDSQGSNFSSERKLNLFSN